MHFGEDISCFSLKQEMIGWISLGGGDDRLVSPMHLDNRPVSPMHFREGTSCFSLKQDKDWFGFDYVRSRDRIGYFGVWQILRFVEQDYAISLYSYGVCIYSGSRGQIEIFVLKTSRSSAQYFPSQFQLSWRELILYFQRLQQVWELDR